MSSPFSISPKGHIYDRHVPEPLPVHRMLSLTPGPVIVADLRPNCGPVKDQGQEGACTAHADTEGGEWEFRAYLGKQPIFSPQYTYAKELIANGDFPNDCGSDGETACEVAITSGFCELSLYPYVPGQILLPTVDQDVNASQYRLGAYHGLVGSATAISIVTDPTPWPVLVGFTVYDSFESDQLAETGVMPIPDPSENVLGGHEVLMVGCDTGVVPVIRPQGCPPAALILNSWGPGWGLGGFFWMPLQILDASDTDLKIVHIGHPWR